MNGSGNATLPALRLVPPTAAQSYFIAAKKLYAGVKALLQGAPGVELAFSLLAAQALECALKAYLSQHGYEEKKLKNREVGHNLEVLWSMSEKKLLGISPEPPKWCVTLNSAHDKPYYFRYPMGLNGMVYPNSKETEEGLSEVLRVVEASLSRNAG